MIIIDTRIDILNNLGLSQLEAKTYLMLVRNSDAKKIQTIAKSLSADRSNIYRVVANLEKMGLVEKILNTPNRYQAIPLKEGIKTLLKYKENEFSSIKIQANELIRQQQQKGRGIDENEYELKVYRKEKNRLLKRIETNKNEAKQSFDILCDIKSFHNVELILKETILECINRGVKYRVISPRTDFDSEQRITIQNYMRYPNYQLKFINFTPKTNLFIRDKNTAWINLITKTRFAESKILETTHLGCIEMFQNHFNMIWNQTPNIQMQS